MKKINEETWNTIMTELYDNKKCCDDKNDINVYDSLIEFMAKNYKEPKYS